MSCTTSPGNTLGKKALKCLIASNHNFPSRDDKKKPLLQNGEDGSHQDNVVLG